MADKKDIRDFTLGELKGQMKAISEPSYRAVQVFSWLYKKGVERFDDMRNISKPLRDKLNKLYYIGFLEPAEHLKSIDGTEKFLFRLSDGNCIETVLIYSPHRETLCLSTQVGCKYRCCFCASGTKGFIRDLSPSEITGQALFLRNRLNYNITNFVFMGMGEPFDNYENLFKALSIMNEPEGMAVAARRITISTCGIVPGINKLKDLGMQVNLSISLHAADDRLRDSLMPVNKTYPLEKLIKACEDYRQKKGRIITIEYVLIKGKNDSIKDADGLSGIARRIRAKVNLLPYSEVACFGLRPPPQKDIDIFMQRLVENGVGVTLRRSKGKDIQAACGQLAGRLNP